MAVAESGAFGYGSPLEKVPNVQLASTQMAQALYAGGIDQFNAVVVDRHVQVVAEVIRIRTDGFAFLFLQVRIAMVAFCMV